MNPPPPATAWLLRQKEAISRNPVADDTDCVARRYLEGLPHFRPVFLPERISRSLPADAQRLTSRPGPVDCAPLPFKVASLSTIASATAKAMAATLSLSQLSPSKSSGTALVLAPLLPGTSRLITMMAIIKMVSAAMTTTTPTTAIVAASPICK
jgi:hypothetical protein